MNDSQDTEKRVEAGMTDDQLMKLVTRYTETCVNPASGLFEQPASDTDSKHAKVAQLWAQIGAEVQRLHAEGAKSERRAIAFGDSLHHNILAMRAAVVAWQREGAAAGMKWIANSLAGPGHLPSEPDIALGAQALFDIEMAEHEAFRIAHPAPEALRTSGDSHTAPLRNASADGHGKYAVLNLRKLALDMPLTPSVQPALPGLETTPALNDSGADISACGRYRYSLWRRWGPGPSVLFVGLNPSTADATLDDPTIRRCIGFARAWGYGGLVMANLFAWRDTAPAGMMAAADPVGPDNDRVLQAEHVRAALTVAAWGAHGAHLGRDEVVRALLPRLHCLRLTKHGHPGHPLYLPASLQPVPWLVPDSEGGP